jgi:hypothetical protein
MKKKLGEILLEMGAVRPEALQVALDAQGAGDPSRLGDLLVAVGAVTQAAIAQALGKQFDLPFVQLDQVSAEVASLVPMELQQQHKIVPFKDEGPGKSVHVAVADPSTREVLTELEFQIGRPLVASIAAADDIASVHAALSGDVVAAVVIADEEPAAPPPIAPLPPVPVPSPAPAASPGKAALGKLALKRVAVPVGSTGGTVNPIAVASPPAAAVPSFAADFPSLELELPKAVPRPRASAPSPAPRAAPPPPDPSAPSVVTMVHPPAAADLARSKRPAKTEPFAPSTAAEAKPAGAPEALKRPKTVPGIKRPPAVPAAAPATDDWSVKDARAAIPEPTAQFPKFEPKAAAASEPDAKPSPVSSAATAVAPRIEPARPPVKTLAQFPEAARVTTEPSAGAVPSRGQLKTDAALPEAAPVADAPLPAWMREGSADGSGGDALAAAVEKAVLVGGTPRTVARLLRVLVDRGLLTEKDIIDELEKP